MTAARGDRLATLSRYTRRTLPWITGSPEEQVGYLLRQARDHHLDGWALFPTVDRSAALLSRFRRELATRFRVTTPDWDVLRWAYDKRLTYQLAAQESIDHPWTLCPASEADLEAVDGRFPVILKPAVKADSNQFTADKAWPAENRDRLLARYREARALVPPELILVQDMIPGGGEAQFSFTALCSEGRPIASLTARRTRQYPIDFGRGSSFVETVEVPEIEAPAHRLLAAIHYTGLVELEFKYDRRDRRYKLLDFNARIWTWSSLCCRAGVDYPYLLWRMMLGNRVPEIRGRAGVRWVRMLADVPAAFQELVRGRLRVADYVRSFRGPLEFALSAADDPWPGVLDVPIRAHAFTTKILAHATNLARTVNWTHARGRAPGPKLDESLPR
ncbi:MAG: hypothetical protein AUH74_05225 [Nitrospirae bacterium 13_1_40CM_4_62_6]|nr:MAG: hypothetical protein AUH74_05225 [Nitrospirae bacterium 13_1_40CM_4_62_6]